MDIPKYEELNDANCQERSIKKHYPEFYEYLITKFPGYKWGEKLALYYYGLEEPPRCVVCGKAVKFYSFRRGWARTCSVRCTGKDPEVVCKKIKRSIEKYGTSNPMQSQEVKDKIKKTCLERYGVEYSLQYKANREKIKQTKLERYGDANFTNPEKSKKTCLERYGVEYSFQDKVSREKAKQTKLERYGDVNYSNFEKARKTCLEKYGVEYNFQDKANQAKARQTMLERYGVEYASQSLEIKKKISKSKNESIIQKNPNILRIENNIYTYKCQDPNCNRCEEKCFDIEPNTLYYRLIRKTPFLCTRLYPHNPNCIKETGLEKFVSLLLDDYNIEYEKNNRKILDGKELDIYIPSHKLAIECNGCYWHSTNMNDVNNRYHYNKFMNCKEKGIQLLTVWEDQIVNSPEKIESIILSKLGIYKRRLYARECSVHLVDSEHCREFLDCYHLQGSVNSSVRLGLYYNDELISIMTFGKGRKCLNSSDEWELYRYCCKGGVQVVGGASKLFKYFINNYHPNSVISFSSNDISDGSLYKVLNFERVKDGLSYWYIKDNIRYHRYNFTKQKLIKEGYDPNMTESEIMTNRGFYCIYDTGQTKWKWSKKSI